MTKETAEMLMVYGAYGILSFTLLGMIVGYIITSRNGEKLSFTAKKNDEMDIDRAKESHLDSKSKIAEMLNIENPDEVYNEIKRIGRKIQLGDYSEALDYKESVLIQQNKIQLLEEEKTRLQEQIRQQEKRKL